MREYKKVLVFARHPSGGIRTYFRYVYGQPCMADIAFTFLTPASSALDSVLSTLNNNRGHVTTEDSSFSLFWALLKNLLTARFDLIHSHGFTAGILAAIPARLSGTTHIITTHDVFLDNQFKGWKGRLKRWLIGRFLALADTINPVGEDARDNLIKTYPHLDMQANVVAIRNGIETSAFLLDERRNLRNEVGLDADVLLLGFFGRFMAQKGFRTLVDAVEEWNKDSENRSLHIACFGWGGFIREEQANLKARNLDSFFHFFPATDEMNKALRGVDAVVMPSRWEACPLLPMEAFVAGVPLLATDCIGLKEVTKDTPVLRFPVDDSGSLVAAIKLLQKDCDSLNSKARAFRKIAAERFDVCSTSSSLKKLFIANSSENSKGRFLRNSGKH